MKLKLLTFLIATFSVLLSLWGLGYIFFIFHVANTTPQATDQKTEAIIVLTGGANRINEGLDLLASGNAPKLFITGVNRNVAQKDLINKWAHKNKPKNLCCIELDYEATDTKENAQEIEKWVIKNKIKSLRLVTSDYHFIRAHLETKNLLDDNVEIIQHPVTSQNTYNGKWHFLSLTFREYNKTLLIWTRLDHKKGHKKITTKNHQEN